MLMSLAPSCGLAPRAREGGRTPKAAPASASRRASVFTSKTLRPVSLSASSKERAPDEPSLLAWVTKAAASLFAPADDHNVDWSKTLSPFAGEPLKDKDRQKLARVEQVIVRAKQSLEDEEHNKAASSEDDWGHYLASAVGTVFSKPDVSDDELFKGTLAGWSGDVSGKERLSMRLEAFRKTMKAP